MQHKYFFMLACAMCACVSFAQDAADLRLDQIDVYGVKAHTGSALRNTITTISAEQIALIPAASINELLDLLPGVDIRTRGANGAQADISMRGGTNDQVLILLNGVNITDPRTGHANLDLPIDLSAIKRIEVLQGTALEQFGLNAFAGAINIITIEPSQNAAIGSQHLLSHKASIAAGDKGFFAPAYTISGDSKDINWITSANYNRSTGYMHNTDYAYGNVFTAGVANNSLSGKWQWQAGGQMKKFGSNGFYSLRFPNQYEQTRTAFASLSWQKQIKQWTIESSLYYRLHHDVWYLYRPDFDGYPADYQPNRHLTQLGGINAKAHFTSVIGRTSFGVELRDEHILSSVLGEQRNNISADATFQYAKNRFNINYFLQQSFVWAQNWSAQLAVAGNYNTMFVNNYTFSTQISWQYAPLSSLYASASRTLRLPTFTDLYYKSVTQIANPNLQPEISYNFELGTKYVHLFDNHWQLSCAASAYYRIGNNIIDWIKRPQDEKWLSMNHTRVDAMGGEAQIAMKKDKWNISVGYSFTNLNQQLDPDYQDYISKYALDYLRHKATLQFGHPIWKGFGANWVFSYQQRHGDYLDINNQTCAYKPVFLLDGRIFWAQTFAGKYGVEVYVEGSNLLNISYYDYGGIAQPGRWLKAGISLKI